MGLSSIAVLIPISPAIQISPGIDSSIFIYIGNMILNGAIPYLNVWDHKPPMIYFIDALGLFLGSGTLWGVWFIEILSLLMSSFLSYVLLKRYFSLKIAFRTTLIWIWIILIFTLEGGNFCEEFALLLQFAGLLFFDNSIRKENNKIWYFLFGLAGGLAFLLKQTTIGVAVIGTPILLYTAYTKSNIKKTGLSIILILLGGVLPTLIFIGYFIITDSLNAAIDCFMFNFKYIHTISFLDRICNFVLWFFSIRIWKLLVTIPAFISWFFLIKEKVLNGVRVNIDMSVGLLKLFVIFLFPLELYFFILSGRYYLHYFITVIPVITLLLAFFFHMLETKSKCIGRKTDLYIYVGVFFVILLQVAALFMPESRWKTYLKRFYTQTPKEKMVFVQTVAEKINRLTKDGDTIFNWGYRADLYFLTGKRSPTAYIYQMPLMLLEKISDKNKYFQQLLDDFIKNPPKVIIDEEPLIPFSALNERRKKWLLNNKGVFAYASLVNAEGIYYSTELTAFLTWLKTNYLFREKVVGPDFKYLVYERK